MKIGKLGYVVATAIQALSTFVFLALATRVLGTDRYAQWALIEPLLLIGGQVAMLGVGHGVIRLIAQEGRTSSDVLRVVGRIGLAVSVVIAVIIAIPIGHLLNLGNYSFVLIIIFVAEGYFSLLTSAYRGANHDLNYAFLVTCRAVTSITLMILTMNTQIRESLNANHLMLVWLASTTLPIGIIRFIGKSQISTGKSNLNFQDYKHSIIYGAPILAASVLSAILANADRYILSTNVAPQSLTQYVVAAKIAAILNLCVTPLNLWWPTARFQHLNDLDSGRIFFADAALVICSGLSLVSASVYLFSPELLILLAPNANFDPVVTGLLCIATLSIAMTAPLNIGGLKQGKTQWLAISVFIAATTQIALAVLLIPLLGIKGAAIATMCSSLLSLLFQNLISQRIHPVPFHYILMIATALIWLSACIYVASSHASFLIRCFILFACTGLNLWLLKQCGSWSRMSRNSRN